MDAPDETPIARDLSALTPAERERRQTLADQLRAATQGVQERPDGFAFRYPAALLLTAAEFVALERRCCPFFRFAFALEPGGGPLWLAIAGRAGVKAFLRAELGLGVEEART